ncbi:signal transduction histidine kinase [Catenuloplanes nepalensis]|uniref:histidine kinase n=1 Tax=Catenuloplanes nepalensis TaxID=587533 RepID=A0ABT9N1D1_9ACTN|nr:histidine kinase [Catenuloplanes nepalensis]MDP9797501.1 signal transduction histidine kinase [Catenuloplanes nepalensis]
MSFDLRRLRVVVRCRTFAARHRLLVDAGLAALLLVLQFSQRAPGPAGLALVVALHVPLIWRRARPVPAFWATLAVAMVCDLHAWQFEPRRPFVFAVLMAALYAVALHEPDRRHLWAAVVGAELASVIMLASARSWTEYSGAVLFATALLAAAASLGVVRQTRRAYLAELEERARRLERESDQQAQLAVAAERARIAREMHDIVAHNLTVMVALADGAALTVSRSPELAADTMHKVSATGRQALGEMRRLLGLLRADVPAPAPRVRAPQPGFADIDGLIAQVRTAGLTVTVAQHGLPVEAWGPGAGLTAYRLVQEALTNTLKHAGPGTNARVDLRYEPHGMELSVTDDGRAPARTSPGAGGHGLAGMAERVGSYDGTVESGPLAEGGWRVRARLTFGAVA